MESLGYVVALSWQNSRDQDTCMNGIVCLATWNRYSFEPHRAASDHAAPIIDGALSPLPAEVYGAFGLWSMNMIWKVNVMWFQFVRVLFRSSLFRSFLGGCLRIVKRTRSPAGKVFWPSFSVCVSLCVHVSLYLYCRECFKGWGCFKCRLVWDIILMADN